MFDGSPPPSIETYDIWMVPPFTVRICANGFPATLGPIWIGLLTRPSAMNFPVAETLTLLPAAISTSAQGWIVTVPLIVVLDDRICGLVSAVHVSEFIDPAWDVGPAVGFAQSIATALATSARIAPAVLPNNSIP